MEKIKKTIEFDETLIELSAMTDESLVVYRGSINGINYRIEIIAHKAIKKVE